MVGCSQTSQLHGQAAVVLKRVLGPLSWSILGAAEERSSFLGPSKGVSYHYCSVPIPSYSFPSLSFFPFSLIHEDYTCLCLITPGAGIGLD